MSDAVGVGGPDTWDVTLAAALGASVHRCAVGPCRAHQGARRSDIGGLAQAQQMLDVGAEHDIGATMEPIRTDAVDAAYDKVVADQVRYQYVVDTATIPPTPKEPGTA